MDISYAYFFRVELLHKYFTDNVCNDFTITPSAATQPVLRGNKMIFKQYGNVLYTGIQVDDAGKVVLVPSASLQLTFFLQLNNPLFFNYTNLPNAFTAGKIYYFTNRNNNVSNNRNFISLFEPYDNAKAYQPGDIAPDGGGIIFQCIAGCTGIIPSTGNTVNWMKIDSNRYMTESDALQWMPSVSTYTFPAEQTSAAINVFGYDMVTKTFTQLLVNKTTVFPQSAKSFTLDLSVLSPGKYRLTVNGDEKFIYINDELSTKQVFAVVDIFNDSTLAAAYKLLDDAVLSPPGKVSVLSPLYTVSFLNRATIWKYILKTGSKGIITLVTPDTIPNSPPDEPPDPHFPATAANAIISKSPIPLSQTPLKLGLALSTIDNKAKVPKLDIADIASASPQRLTTFSKNNDLYACSEIFLNY